MKLQTVTCYAVEIPAKDGSYAMSRDRVLRSFPSTVVRMTAEDGTSGFAEACSLGANYFDGFPGSIQATIRELAPFVLQCDPLEPNVLADGMDALIIGHLPGKAAIDTAMWDLRGKLLGLPVAGLLGGIKQESFGAFQAISLGPPATMAAEVSRMADLGFRRWQLKLGDDPLVTAQRVHAAVSVLPAGSDLLTSDANRGWTSSAGSARGHDRPRPLPRDRMLHRPAHALLLPESRAIRAQTAIRRRHPSAGQCSRSGRRC